MSWMARKRYEVDDRQGSRSRGLSFGDVEDGPVEVDARVADPAGPMHEHRAEERGPQIGPTGYESNGLYMDRVYREEKRGKECSTAAGNEAPRQQPDQERVSDVKRDVGAVKERGPTSAE